MTGSGFNKSGWHWTRKGWKRTPKHLQTVKNVPPPKKRKHRKNVHARANATEAPNLTVGQGGEVSAPTPAPTSAEPAPRQYRELDAVTKRLNRPASRRSSINPPWIKKKAEPQEPRKRAWHGKYDDLNTD